MRLGEERTVPRGVQHAGHADDPLAREARLLHGHVAHHVERVRDHDDDALRRDALDFARHRADDAGVRLDQVVPAHARLPGDAGGHDEDLRPRRLVVAVRADDPGVESLDRCRLPLVESLALRDAFDDVDHDDGAGEVLLGEALGGGGADVASADDGDLLQHWLLSPRSGSGWMGSAPKAKGPVASLKGRFVNADGDSASSSAGRRRSRAPASYREPARRFYANLHKARR